MARCRSTSAAVAPATRRDQWRIDLYATRLRGKDWSTQIAGQCRSQLWHMRIALGRAVLRTEYRDSYSGLLVGVSSPRRPHVGCRIISGFLSAHLGNQQRAASTCRSGGSKEVQEVITTAANPLLLSDIDDRIRVYNADQEMCFALGAVWSRAHVEMIEVIRAYWTGILEREARPFDGPQTNVGIVERLVATTRERWTKPIDRDWVLSLIAQGCDIFALALPSYSVADRIVRLQMALCTRLIERFSDDAAFVARATRASQWLAMVEFEVMSATVAALRQQDAVDQLAATSSAFLAVVRGEVDAAISCSQNLRSRSERTAQSASATLRHTAEVAIASGQSAQAMHQAAATAARLITAIDEVRSQVISSGKITERGLAEADRVVRINQALEVNVRKIDAVLVLVREIALRTSLLALNASIEAARAGSAGAGFAVVAQEINALAKQTNGAIDDIASKISASQAATAETLSASAAIHVMIEEMATAARSVQVAMDAQADTVASIAAAVDETALAATTTSSNVLAIEGQSDAVVHEIANLNEGFELVEGRLARLDECTRQFVAVIGAGEPTKQAIGPGI